VSGFSDEIEGCVSILDCILIYGRTIAEHDERLHRVLDRLVKYKLRQVRHRRTGSDFNDHRVSAADIRPLTFNVETIQAIPVHANKHETAATIRLYGLVLSQVHSRLCRDLRQLFKEDAVWNWSTACPHSIELFKTKIVSPPVLAPFDVNAPTIVTCNVRSLSCPERQRNVVTQRQNVKLSPACGPVSTGIFTCTAAASR